MGARITMDDREGGGFLIRLLFGTSEVWETEIEPDGSWKATQLQVLAEGTDPVPVMDVGKGKMEPPDADEPHQTLVAWACVMRDNVTALNTFFHEVMPQIEHGRILA